MPVIFYKECRESIYLNTHTYWNVNDVGVKCDKCNATNTITLENGPIPKATSPKQSLTSYS
jgi:hypothetical protein